MRVPLFIACLLVVFAAACKKDQDHTKKGYTLTTAFKNELSVPVEIRRGAIWPRAPYKPDTLVYRDTLKIAAHGLYEQQQFICTENCNPEGVYYTSVAPAYNISKIVIQGKERMDTSCPAKAYVLKMQFFKCDELQTGAANIYDQRRYKETKDAKGNVIRREYVFDAADLAAMP